MCRADWGRKPQFFNFTTLPILFYTKRAKPAILFKSQLVMACFVENCSFVKLHITCKI